MLLRDYRKLAGITLEGMLAQLRAVAAPGELATMSNVTIYRHETGLRFPAARTQRLYEIATAGAVKPQDHVQARTAYETGLSATQRERETENA